MAPDISTPQGQRDRAIIEVLYSSGLRVSELVGLNLSDLDLERGEVKVLGKGGKERICLLGEPARRALKLYIREGRRRLMEGDGATDALFLNRFGGRLSVRSVDSIVGKYSRIAGLTKRVTPHILRHTFATHLMDGGADLRVVQELLGHARLATTQIYTHVSKSRAREIYLKSHPRARGSK
jgi:integrase/recombinase XerC